VLVLGRKVLGKLLRANAVHKALGDGLKHARLLIHVLHLVYGCSRHLTCSSTNCMAYTS